MALDANRFVLHTPSNFKRDIIMARYLPVIQKALHELFSADFEVVVLGEGELEDFGKKKTDDVFLPGTEEYTFERFVVGASNKFAHAAAQAVAERPAQTYNPLFIYGESGLGKTHLLYAIAHKIHQNHPDYRIVYIKGDSFTNELIQAIREGRNPEFREKYRSADVFPHGRRAVHRRPRVHPGGDVPHLQHPVRSGPPDRIHRRPAAQRDAAAGRSSAHPV